MNERPPLAVAPRNARHPHRALMPLDDEPAAANEPGGIVPERWMIAASPGRRNPALPAGTRATANR
jgi:hypothetical protein